MDKKVILLVAFLVIVFALGFSAFYVVKYVAPVKFKDVIKDDGENEMTSFEECAAAGNPIMESYPRQCRAGGKLFVEDIDVEPEEDFEDTFLTYEIFGCDEENYTQTKPQIKRGENVDVEVDGGAVYFTHYLNYVCCADIEVKIANIQKKSDHVFIKLLEKNTGEMCECTCDYDIDMVLSPVLPGDYVVEMWGVGYDNDTKLEMLWKQEFNVEGAPCCDEFPEEVEDIDDIENSAQLANPASVYCEDWGGEVEIRDFLDGSKGFCLFEDGSECEEWDYFRDDCFEGENFCKDMCGDGECQEVVCEAVGCPCSETKQSCAKDCN